MVLSLALLGAARGRCAGLDGPALTVPSGPAADEVEGKISALASEESPSGRVRLIRELNTGALRGGRSFRAGADLMFRDLSDEVRKAAALAVATYPGGGSVELLDKFLSSEQGPEVRGEVCLELSTAPAHRTSPEVTGLLTRVLAEDKEREVRSAALSGLSLRGDRRALDALRRLAGSEPDEGLRRRIKDLVKVLSVPPKIAAPPLKKIRRVSPDAVKGADFCGDGNGWCECALGPLKPKPRCVSRDECTFLYENSFMRQGYRCTWDGGSLTGE